MNDLFIYKSGCQETLTVQADPLKMPGKEQLFCPVEPL